MTLVLGVQPGFTYIMQVVHHWGESETHDWLRFVPHSITRGSIRTDFPVLMHNSWAYFIGFLTIIFSYLNQSERNILCIIKSNIPLAQT
jgi:hypothetical protein